jgi:UDP-2,3-diacylglucosamine pyrophosphatase LpxH
LTQPIKSLRTLFISDIHLGTRGAQADLLLDFIKHHEAETIYLVGDIVDAWRLKKNWYWPQKHNDVVQKLLRQSRKGVRLVYIPGNHDEFMREYVGTHFGGVEVMQDTVHEAADGKRYVVMHGDEFDVVVRYAKWLALLGDWAYVTLLSMNSMVNRVRRRLGFSYWSLSAWAKLKVKNAVNFIGDFQEALAGEAKRRGADGVICGHIHHAVLQNMNGVRYMNCGDWVESCTALAENFDGSFEIIQWTGQAKPLELTSKRAI